MLPEQHFQGPLSTASIGTVGGLGSTLLTWIAERMIVFDQILATLTHCVGFCVAVLTMLILLGRWRRQREETRRPFQEPADVDDNLP
jgi:hypothetical protein